ncbi:MAG: DUF4147 domain-containing protein [Gemmatimonadetes bacterium]|nr:DUF4147 domain-containing protein [Gemmatimonadota bacterium]
MAEPSPFREDIRAILDAAVAAVDPLAVVSRSVRLEGDSLTVRGVAAVDLSALHAVWIVGAGKASRRMAEAALGVLGARVRGGAIAAPAGSAQSLDGLEVWEAGHPIPDAHGLAAAGEALRAANRAAPNDLILCLLSGGASALWSAPPDSVPLADLRVLTRELLRAGAPISELNTVRKHLSRIAGGQLARAAAPARILTLAISDVIGAPPDVIGSGPTLPDPTTYASALEILRLRRVAAPQSVTRHLLRGAAGEIDETAKPGELDNLAGFHLLASVSEALAGAGKAAERLGYRVEVLSETLEGEARKVGAQLARAALQRRDDGAGPVALLWGGETTVTVTGQGKGGRNQELALAAALVLEGEPAVALASFGTDGIDGPTDAAGGLVDGDTARVGRSAGFDPLGALTDNDAYAFLDAAGALLMTGPTGTNVNDVVVALIGEKR